MMRELSHRGLLGAPAVALPAKIPVVQRKPESHLRSETTPRYLSECLKRWLIIPMRLCECHDKILVEAMEPFYIPFALIPSNASAKGVHGKVVH